MRICQDNFFDAKYYLPAHNWFLSNGFTSPLSLLVIYDSFVHSGSMPSFLIKRFSINFPVAGGDEKEWVINYINARHKWLENHSNPLLRKTIYRTACFKEQVQNDNWDLAQKINAHGVNIT